MLVLVRDEPRSVTEIAEHFDITQQAVSQHLKVLKQTGLVHDQTVGTRRIYRLNPAGVRALRDQLDTFWDRAIANYEAAIDDSAEEET